MFRGRFEHTIDQKGRVSIPSGFRMEIERRSEKDPILTSNGDHVVLYPADVWDKREAQLAALSDLDPDSYDLQRHVFGESADAPIDKQGRVLVPVTLRKDGDLQDKVIITGVLNRIEIWNPERYEEKKRMTLMRLGEIQKSVDQRRSPTGD